MVPRLPVVGVLVFVYFQISASQIGAEISGDPDPCAPDRPVVPDDPCAPTTSLSPAGKIAGATIGAITGAAAVGAAGWGIMEGVQHGTAQITTLAPAESSMSSMSFGGSDTMSSAGAPMSSSAAAPSTAVGIVELTAAVLPGETTLPVNGQGSLLVGDTVVIGPGTPQQEDGVIARFGSIIVKQGLVSGHPMGTKIMKKAAAAAAASPGAPAAVAAAAAPGAPAPSLATPEDNVSSGMTRSQMWLGAGLLALLCCCACLAVALAVMFCKKKPDKRNVVAPIPEAQPLVGGPYMVNVYPPMTVGPAVPVGDMVYPLQTAMPVMPVPTMPMATAGVDTTFDGRANYVVSGVDMNRDGIPDVLQGPMGSPLASPRMWG